MEQKHKWYLESAIDENDLTRINFKSDLLDSNGEPVKELVDFFSGRLKTFNEPFRDRKRKKNMKSLISKIVVFFRLVRKPIPYREETEQVHKPNPTGDWKPLRKTDGK